MNKYWEEQKKKYYSEVTEDQVVSRIKECQFVVEKLEKDTLWQTVLKDANNWIVNIDGNWQDQYEIDKLNQMRVVKLAANQIRNMKQGYVQEWKMAQEELDRRRDPEAVEKDYDAT